MTHRRLPAPLAVSLLALALACGGADHATTEEGSAGSAPAEAPPAAPMPTPAPGADARAQSLALDSDVSTRSAVVAKEAQRVPSSRQSTDSVHPSMIIRSGTATVRVDSLERAMAAVQRIAISLGGWVGSTQLSAGEEQVRSATIELKIPAARYDDALRGLAPIGRVEHVASSAEDVGEEFVDLSARAANARRLEERLVALLATRTGKLDDVLAVERELARVREEIERHEGRLRWLRSRVATSTLLVTVHEPHPVVGRHPGDNPIGEAFRQMWRNFVGVVAALIASLGVVIPVAALGALGWVLVRRWRPGVKKAAQGV